jgi:uncharacterized protein YcbX
MYIDPLHRYPVKGLTPEAVGRVGRRRRLGTAVLEVTARITRCGATRVNPLTGERDAGDQVLAGVGGG